MTLFARRSVKTPPLIDRDTLVDDLLRDHPQTARVFLDSGMKCVGCPIGIFHTIEDAAREHGLDRAALEARLRRAIDDEEA